MLNKLLDKIKEVKYTTLDARSRLHGCMAARLHSRPMYTCESDTDEALWFFSEKNAQKIAEIRHNDQVGLGYSDPNKATCVTIASRAGIMDEHHKTK
ncbi:hypothetical protein DDQ68_19665 [Hymenobacter nivis]|uniref:General stress protein FMN-binding split barrel domain-containing protein n=1 Tax=Hymenobacter nivis TaxID=1850093 RepID=A0A2Z3GKS0_9BACT|nr:hypothetical protein DDQ68_19665 [Hymenobacter nivis]